MRPVSTSSPSSPTTATPRPTAATTTSRSSTSRDRLDDRLLRLGLALLVSLVSVFETGAQAHRPENGVPRAGRACTLVGVIDSAGLLAAYDTQLRTDAETPGALSVTRQGPLRLVTFSSGRGFITYQGPGGGDAGSVRRVGPAGVAHFPG